MTTMQEHAERHAWILDPENSITITESAEPRCFAEALRAVGSAVTGDFVIDTLEGLKDHPTFEEEPEPEYVEQATTRYIQAHVEEDPTHAFNRPTWDEPEPSRTRRFFHRLMPTKVAL